MDFDQFLITVSSSSLLQILLLHSQVELLFVCFLVSVVLLDWNTNHLFVDTNREV